MGNELVNFLTNINLCFVSLTIIVFILSFLFLSKKKVNSFLKRLYIIIYVILSWLCFYFFNDVFNEIFNLSYFSVKAYLLLLIIVNIITIVNINFVKKIVYKVINYMMFLVNALIFFMAGFILLGSKLDIIKASSDDLFKFMNINFIAFLVYLNIMGVIYLIDMLFNRKKVEKNNITIDNVISNELEIDDVEIEDIEEEYKDNEEACFGDNSNGFVIDGIDCSAIFDNSSHDEIMKNYYILLNDVNAKLINGYTIHEYTKIKSIIDKLGIKDLSKVKLDINKLSAITYDEYNLLKSYLNSKNIKI